MPKTIIAALLSIAVLITLGGREIYKNDIANRLIIQGIGIDLEDDGTYTVTAQAINTSVQSASTNETVDNTVKVYSVNGKTVYTAVKRIFEYEGHMPLYSQNRVIVIGKKVAEKGIRGVVDFFARDADNGPSVYMAMAENRASEILEVTTENEIEMKNIDLALRSAEYEAQIYCLELYELINGYFTDSACFAMPTLFLSEETDGKKSVQVKDTAVFKDARFHTSLNREETAMLNFLSDRVYNGAFAYLSDEGEKTAASVVRSKTERKAGMENGAPNFKTALNLTVDIAEIYDGEEKRVDRARLSALEESAEEYLAKMLRQAIEKLYPENETELCDAVGFSRLLWRKFPSYYRENSENLNAVLANSAYSVEVNVKIRRVGHEFVEMS